MRREDTLIGVADGAPWIDNLFDQLGVEQRILDVYHATCYLDTVMLALGWNDEQRLAHRCSWQRGDINARVWLRHYLPDPELWLAWEPQVLTALRYLEARLNQTDYFDFKAKGYPKVPSKAGIGSGQIEGANKSVIGARMKHGGKVPGAAGMRWSFEGINRMATLRSNQCSAKPFLDFHTTRLLAFAP